MYGRLITRHLRYSFMTSWRRGWHHDVVIMTSLYKQTQCCQLTRLSLESRQLYYNHRLVKSTLNYWLIGLCLVYARDFPTGKNKIPKWYISGFIWRFLTSQVAGDETSLGCVFRSKDSKKIASFSWENTIMVSSFGSSYWA